MTTPVLALFVVLLDAALKGVLLLALAGLVNLVLYRASAAARQMVWSIAMLGVLVLPVLGWLLPAWRLPVLPRQTPVVRLVIPPVLPAAPSPVVAPSLEIRPTETPTASPVDGSGARRADAATAPPVRRHWSAWVLLTWAVGTAILLGLQLAGILGVWRLRRRSQPVTDADWSGLAERSARELGLKRRVALLESDGAVMPMTWGWLRPVILLPADCERWPADRRRIVLLHELAHVKRLDYLTQTVSRAVCAGYWFNPLVWVANYRLRVERERACDDCVLRAGAKASDYAAQLLELAGELRVVPGASLGAIPMARRFRLEARLLAILDPKRSRRSVSRIMGAILMLAAAGILVPLAAVRFSVRAEEPRTGATPSPAVTSNTVTVATPANFSPAEEQKLNEQLLAALHAPGLDQLGQLRAALEAGADPNALLPDGFTPLMEVCYPGNVEVVRLLLDHGADINGKDRYGNETVLARAALNGSTPIVKLLLARGADVKDGWPVWEAVGRPAVLDLLLRAGADVNVRYPTHRGTPLMEAVARDGSTDSAKLLIEHGANLELRSSYGETAWELAAKLGRLQFMELLEKAGAKRARDLWIAAATGELDAVKALVAKGADVNALDQAGGSALQYAAGNGHAAVVSFLVENGAKVNALAKREGCDEIGCWRGPTPLLCAAAAGHGEIVRFLVAHGADINVKDLHGETALMAAAGTGQIGMVDDLVKAGADVNAKGRGPETAMYYAAWHPEIADYLLDHGARVLTNADIRYQMAFSPLIFWSSHGNPRVVKLLLDQRVDVNSTMPDGRNALMIVAGNPPDPHQDKQRLEIVNLLLDRGIDVDYRPKDSPSALGFAIANASPEITLAILARVQDLGRQFPDAYSPLSGAIGHGQPAIVRALIARGAREDLGSEPGNQLFVAAALGDLEKVKALVAQGADVKAVGKRNGYGALGAGAAMGHDAIVQALLAAGARPDAYSLTLAAGNGRLSTVKLLLAAGFSPVEVSPLSEAALRGRIDVVKLLLTAGAKVDGNDTEPVETPLISAAGAGHTDIVRLLIQHGANVNAKGYGEWSALKAALSRQNSEMVAILRQAGAKE